MIAANRRRMGASLIISAIEAGAPMTAKKMWIRKVPTSWAPEMFPKNFGKKEASAVVIVVISRY